MVSHKIKLIVSYKQQYLFEISRLILLEKDEIQNIIEKLMTNDYAVHPGNLEPQPPITIIEKIKILYYFLILISI
jgi:hypothetical protein